LREVFGPALEVDVAEQTPSVAKRLYPDIPFHAGFHATDPDWPRWRARGLWASLRKRRTSLAIRLLRRAPVVARWLLTARQRQHLDRLARADAVVATGGTYFVEHYDLTPRADEVLAAQALGKPTFLFTQSLGPFRDRSNRALMRRIVAGCAAVFLRDEPSRRHLMELGPGPDRIQVHADAAFALPPPAPRTVQPGTPRRVAISVREWSHFHGVHRAEAEERYRRAVADAVRTLADEGVEVTFVSTCQGVPEYWADDARYARRLVDDLLGGETSVRADACWRAPQALAEALQGFDVVIATRMHCAILALVAGTPVVAIAYEFKSRELLHALGRDTWVMDIEVVTGPDLVRAVHEVLDGGTALRAELARRVAGFRSDAIIPARVIAERLGRVV
jgi:colanic acid/amylovoran biosynthesis protein